MGMANRVGILAVVLLTTACNEPQGVIASELTSSCALATGTYVSEATLRSKAGVCPRAKDHTRDRMVFDDDGAFISPAAVFIPCSTAQVACNVNITCQVLDLQLKFTGELVDEGSRLVGVATFTGSGDCKSIIYDVDAARPQP